MKKLALSLTLLCLGILPLSQTFAQAVHSQLWGAASNPTWDPETSILRDFTGVGYMGGETAIPDWPIGVNVTDYGATPDDATSDVDAFLDAIANCPPYHAVYVPNGEYIIDDQISVSQNNIVIRGESRDGTILFFPKHTNEIRETVTSSSEPFIRFGGGSNRGIEDLSLVFRDEQKGTGYVNRGLPKQNAPHWWYNGERQITFGSKESNSWMRNVYVKNGNHPISVNKSSNITIMNVVMDDFAGRADPDQGGVVGHMGIYIGDGSKNCLIHNILMTGNYVHDIAVMGVRDSVFSRIRGPGVRLDHHAGGNPGVLFTEVDYGNYAGYGDTPNVSTATFWGLNGINDASYLPTSKPCIFVGIKTSEPTSIGATWHHETLDPDLLTPANLYLAQMAHKNMTNIPADMELTLPPAVVLGDAPAPPAAPTGLGAVLDGTKVILDWDDNPETNAITYNVYRNVNGEGYKMDAMGLRWSDYENAPVNDDSRYYYQVSAVDAWGQESPPSDVIAATIGGKVSNLPLFRYDPIVEANAKEGVPYMATLADKALNPEPFEMTYSLLSAPTWLNVAPDGTLTGIPTVDDVGMNSFSVQLEAENGIDTSTVQIEVLPASTTNVFINESGDGLISDGTNWSTGLPTSSNNIGFIDSDSKFDPSDRNTYYIIHTAGSIGIVGFGRDPKLVGGTFTQNGGTWGSSGNRGFRIDSGNITTLNDGAIHSGARGNAHISGGSELIINGGTFTQSWKRKVYVSDSTLTINGGTLTVEQTIQSPDGLLNFNGGTTSASSLIIEGDSTARFGGTSPGSVTVATLSAGTVDWLPGTKLSLTVTGTDDWAQGLWNADKLTYQGQSKTDLGLDWAAVTSTGLGDGSEFVYDSSTKTLTLLSD